MPELGLFPLPLVLLPGERIPLHIFEERYKELIGECLETGNEFGLVLADAGGVRSTGTRARVSEVSRRFPDGRLDIVVEGGTRFRILRITGGRSFTTAEVEELPEEGDESTPEERSRCIEAYRRLVRAAGEEERDFALEPGAISFQIAGRIDFGVEAKQELLELSSERRRVARLTELLEGAATVADLQRLARERAVGNGKVEGPERA